MTPLSRGLFPEAPPGVVPVKALNLSCPKQLPLSLKSQPLQPLPGCVHLVLLSLDQLLLRVLLLNKEENKEAPWPTASGTPTSPQGGSLRDLLQPTSILLKTFWFSGWNEVKLIPRLGGEHALCLGGCCVYEAVMSSAPEPGCEPPLRSSLGETLTHTVSAHLVKCV